MHDIEQIIQGEMQNIELQLSHLEQVLSQWAQHIYDAVSTYKQAMGSLTSQLQASSFSGELKKDRVSTFPSSASPIDDPKNPFHNYYGQCTWWTAERIHQLTGQWVPMRGNAGNWKAEAPSNWHIPTVPTVGSILVLAPYTQGTLGDGHVAVVEQILPGGWVLTSNMNWPAGSTNVTFIKFHYPDPGVSFVSPP